MNKKYQIFISSTYEDLKEERRKVQDTILSMYHFPIGMEMFSASNRKQWEIIKETIDSSDYYVLIIAHRYGSTIEYGEDSGISYTQKEFRYALKRGIPILAFFIDEEKAAVTVGKMEKDLDKMRRLEEFKKEVKDAFTVQWWENKYDLAIKVMNSLNKKIQENNMPGWVRADFFKSQVRQNKENKKYFSVFAINTREEIDEQLNPLKNMFTNVRSLNIVTVSGINLLDSKSKKIMNLLENNIKIKVVVLKPGTEAFKEHFLYKLDSLGHLKDSSETTWESWKELCDKYRSLFLKYTNICIPYSILYVEKEDENESFIKVDIYSIHAEPNERPCLYIKRSDKMFDYFIEQFKIIWDSGQPI